MKTVIDIDTTTKKSALKSVPKDYIDCSVCGKYYPKDAYCKDGVQVRTNCSCCYNLPMEEFTSTKEIKDEIKKSYSYSMLRQQLIEIMNYKEYSIPVADMIAALQKLPVESHLVIKEEGYYSDCNLASCFLPEDPKTIGENVYFTIGFSSQNC